MSTPPHICVSTPPHIAALFFGQMAERNEGGNPELLKPAELVCVSAASKMVASTATYPHEVIRSYMHIQGTGAFRGLTSTSRKVRFGRGTRVVMMSIRVEVCMKHGVLRHCIQNCDTLAPVPSCWDAFARLLAADLGAGRHPRLLPRLLGEPAADDAGGSADVHHI